MDNSKKYKINEGAFSWLLKTLVGKDTAAKLLYYNDPLFDKDELDRLRRDI